MSARDDAVDHPSSDESPDERSSSTLGATEEGEQVPPENDIRPAGEGSTANTSPTMRANDDSDPERKKELDDASYDEAIAATGFKWSNADDALRWNEFKPKNAQHMRRYHEDRMQEFEDVRAAGFLESIVKALAQLPNGNPESVIAHAECTGKVRSAPAGGFDYKTVGGKWVQLYRLIDPPRRISRSDPELRSQSGTLQADTSVGESTSGRDSDDAELDVDATSSDDTLGHEEEPADQGHIPQETDVRETTEQWSAELEISEQGSADRDTVCANDAVSTRDADDE